MYKFPLRIPSNRRVMITQGFHSQELLDQYKAAGINMQFHDANDVVTGTALETYGTPFVCPFPEAKLIAFDDTGVAGTQKADRVQVEYKAPDGTDYIMGGLHFCELVKQDVYKEGETIGYIGNSGFVLPAPDKSNPYNGSHIHLTLRVNGVVVDPSLFFNVNDPYIGEDTGAEHDKTVFGPAPDERPLKFPRDLYFGENGADVALLQDTLRTGGFFPLTQASTGHFGPVTKQAVGDYQIKQGILLSPTDGGYGRCGPMTRARLNA